MQTKTRLSLRKNRPIWYGHLISYVYQNVPRGPISHGHKVYNTNTPVMSDLDFADIHKRLAEQYGIVVIQSITPRGRVYA